MTGWNVEDDVPVLDEGLYPGATMLLELLTAESLEEQDEAIDGEACLGVAIIFGLLDCGPYASWG